VFYIIKGQGIDNFFNSLFGFMNRKTDFFADQKNSWAFVENNYKKWLKKFEDKKEKEAAKKKKKDDEDKAAPDPFSAAQVREITQEEYERKKKEEKDKLENPQPVDDIAVNNTNTSSSDKKEEDKIAEGKVKPSAAHGHTNEKYSWSQTDIKEIGISIPVPSTIKGKDVTVKYEAKTLLVQIKGQDPIIDGEFHQLIKPDSLVWTLEEVKNGKMITISFEKFDTMKWWDCAIKGEQCIDTTKINPEATKLSDIEDPDMKAQVEKMMFDTRQKSMGLPSSEELGKQNMMDQFMKSHPEMDFSKCKFG